MTNLESLREHIRMNYTTDAREEIAWAIEYIDALEREVVTSHALNWQYEGGCNCEICKRRNVPQERP
jgi:hypothetical protein